MGAVIVCVTMFGLGIMVIELGHQYEQSIKTNHLHGNVTMITTHKNYTTLFMDNNTQVVYSSAKHFFFPMQRAGNYITNTTQSRVSLPLDYRYNLKWNMTMPAPMLVDLLNNLGGNSPQANATLTFKQITNDSATFDYEKYGQHILIHCKYKTNECRYLFVNGKWIP